MKIKQVKVAYACTAKTCDKKPESWPLRSLEECFKTIMATVICNGQLIQTVNGIVMSPTPVNQLSHALASTTFAHQPQGDSLTFWLFAAPKIVCSLTIFRRLFGPLKIKAHQRGLYFILPSFKEDCCFTKNDSDGSGLKCWLVPAEQAGLMQTNLPQTSSVGTGHRINNHW